MCVELGSERFQRQLRAFSPSAPAGEGKCQRKNVDAVRRQAAVFSAKGQQYN